MQSWTTALYLAPGVKNSYAHFDALRQHQNAIILELTMRQIVLTLALACLVSGAAAQSAPPAAAGGAPSIKVGDSWRWVRSDRRTKLPEAESKREVTAVTAGRVEGTENQSRFVMTADLVTIESPDFVRLDDGARFIAFPLEVGKKWSFKYEQHNKNNAFKARWQWDAEVVGYEKVKVPAGEFDTYKIVSVGYFNGLAGGNGSARSTLWYAPAARASVRSTLDAGNNSSETELVEMKLVP